jgi:hypothetical protein
LGSEDTTAVVSFRALRPLPKTPTWVYDYSQHLLDANGATHWTVKNAKSEEMGIGAEAPKWNAVRRCWQAKYSFRVGQIPRGAVRFCAALGLKGEEMLPVQALARP